MTPAISSTVATFEVLCLLSTSCAVPPAHRVTSARGIVRAADPEDAQKLAGLLEEVAPLLLAQAPGLHERPLEIWRVREINKWLAPDERVLAARFLPHADRIEIVDEGPLTDRLLLAHELFHAWADTTWNRLPAIAIEGLADALACRADPTDAPILRATRLSSLALAAGLSEVHMILLLGGDRGRRLRITFQPKASVQPLPARVDANDLARPGSGTSYAVGLVLVEAILERHGIARLRAVCEEAVLEDRDVSASSLLELAGLPEETARWPSPWSRFGEAEWSSLLWELHTFLIPPLVAECSKVYGEFSAEQCLERADPRFGRDELILVSVRNHAEFCAEFARAWNSRPSLDSIH